MADPEQRQEAWTRLMAAVEGMRFNAYRVMALQYLQAITNKNKATAPVLPGEIVLFGRMHLNGKAFPEPTGDEAWEGRMTWSGARVVRPASYYKLYNGLATSPVLRIEVDDDDQAIVLLRDGATMNLRGKSVSLIGENRDAYAPVLRTAQERQKLRESLQKLDSRR